MKQEEQKHQLTQIHLSNGGTQPKAPVSRPAGFPDRKCPDPSAYLRSDRYPNPSFTEYRTRMAI